MNGDDPQEERQREHQIPDEPLEGIDRVAVGSAEPSSVRVRRQIDEQYSARAARGYSAAALAVSSSPEKVATAIERAKWRTDILQDALLSELDQLDLRLHLLEAEQEKQGMPKERCRLHYDCRGCGTRVAVIVDAYGHEPSVLCKSCDVYMQLEPHSQRKLPEPDRRGKIHG